MLVKNSITSFLVIMSILAVFPIFLIVQYASAQSSDCYTRFLFGWHTLNPVLDCMEERLDAGGGGSHALDDLTDVVITTPLITQVVKYNGTAWVNGADLLGLGNPHTLLNSTSHIDTVTSSVTRGDLVYGNSTPAWDDLAIGSASKYLRSDGTDASWSYQNAVLYTENTTASINDDIIFCSNLSSTLTLGLPTASGNAGKMYKIINIGILCRIDPNASQLINNALTYDLDSSRSAVDIITDGSAWFIVGHHRVNFFDDINDSDVATNTDATSGDLIIATDDTNPIWDDLAIGTNGQVLTVDTTGSPDLKWTSPSCTNTGTGEAVCESANNINSLIAGTRITITDTTGDLTIANTLMGASVGEVFVSKTMTNIGTSNVDIYTTAFDQEDMVMVDCTNITDMRIVYMWDYVGTGTQTIRWVNVADNSNILYTTTRVADADAIDSGWFTKPAFCSGIITFEQQGSSTTAGDDPVAKGYVIYAR